MRRIVLVLVVGLLHCAGVARADMLTIYVDGIDFTRSAVRSEASFGGAVGAVLGPAPDRPTSYLQNSWLGSALAKEVGGLQRSIPWNGDLSDTTNINTAIRTLELELINGAQAGHRINLVTHSMGTVIGYLALLDLAIRTKKETSAYQGVENFVTLASPLAHGTHLKVIRAFGQNSVFMIPSSESGLRTAAEIRIRNRWTNVYADGDAFSGSLGVSDARNSALPAVAGVNSHSEPYLHYGTIRALIAQFGGAAAATSLTGSVPSPTSSSSAEGGRAALVTWEYTVTITSTSGLRANPDFFPRQPQVGETYTVVQVFDPQTPDSDTRAIFGGYTGANKSFTLRFANMPDIVLRAEEFPIVNPTNNRILITDGRTADTDEYEASLEGSSIGRTLRIRLFGTPRTTLMSDELPLVPPNPTLFGTARSMYFAVSGSAVYGRIESIVVR